MECDHVVPLDHTARGLDAAELEAELKKQVIGQDTAVEQLCTGFQTYMAGLNSPGKPVMSLLFLGPTGTGKTKLAEALSNSLFGQEDSILKIDCAEFQESHSIAKIIGAPSGYVGHKDTKPFITQEKLDKHHTKHLKMSIVLFDEIEKASRGFYDLLLGILDKATLTLCDGSVVNFSKSIILMTSNIGSREVEQEAGAVGFGTSIRSGPMDNSRVDKISVETARKKFSPEFWNRIDTVITFNPLPIANIKSILRIELGKVQKRILSGPTHQKFVFSYGSDVEDYLIERGYDKRYGARGIKRIIERTIVVPLSNLLMSGQIDLGDLIRVKVVDSELKFDKIPADAVLETAGSDYLPAIGE